MVNVIYIIFEYTLFTFHNYMQLITHQFLQALLEQNSRTLRNVATKSL